MSDQEINQLSTQTPSLWLNRDYMLLWSGQVISTLGTTASTIVYPLLILSLTNSPAAAGFAGALGSIPYIVFSLPVGALIDRWDRKRVMILCDIGRGLTLASIPVALWLGVLTVWQIYAAALIEGSLFVFFNIAEVAALPRVVLKEQLPAAAAQNEAAFSAAAILGPSLGTFLYQAVGHGAPFVADAISYAASVISLRFIRTEFQGQRTAVKRHLRLEIAEGLSWIWHQPLIRFIAFLTGGMNMVGSGSALIIILIARHLGASDAEIGVIFSIAGFGGILGSLVGGQIQRRFTFGQVIIASVWLQALLFPLYVAVPQFLLLGVLTALIYLTAPIYNIVQFSYRLSLIPDELQGRVNSTFRLLAFGFQPLGAALSGLLLQRYGTTPTVIVFAACYLSLALATSFNVHVRTARPIKQAPDA
ncbi:MAG TPA: MFS transporter [Anaerolineales bacterium]|nr:MFS transporter [Anaerolineales bacterium]